MAWVARKLARQLGRGIARPDSTSPARQKLSVWELQPAYLETIRLARERLRTHGAEAYRRSGPSASAQPHLADRDHHLRNAQGASIDPRAGSEFAKAAQRRPRIPAGEAKGGYVEDP